MNDFKKALKVGLDANADANRKRAEIRGVVKELSEALEEATGGVVGVELRPNKKEVVRRLTGVIAAVTGTDKEVRTEKYTGLYAIRLKEPLATEELAEIEMDAAGYPVSVSFSAWNSYVHDRQALGELLTKLLEHPDTGGRIQRLLDIKPKPPTDSTNG